MPPFTHPSGLPKTYDRGPSKPAFTGVVFAEDAFIQGADLNEAQTILRRQIAGVGAMVARDGDRLSGCDITVDTALNRVRLRAGRVYARGAARSIATATLQDVPMTGDVIIGIRLVSAWVTHLEDPDLLGLHTGSLAEGEPAAAREVQTVQWGFAGDGGGGALFSVYFLRDGSVIDQTPPPELSGVNAAIALYDAGAHGHYVVRGCTVTALGRRGDAQAFSVSRGEANIMGFKRTRNDDIRHEETEAPDTELVEAELQTITTAGTAIFTVNHRPIAAVETVTVEKEVTETITRGAISGGADALAHSSVIAVVEVKQGLTTYASPADYALAADKLDWGAGGAEPAPGSTYTVKYRYFDSLAPGAGGYTNDANTITAIGGRNGGQAILRYSWKTPRVDILCLDRNGFIAYIKGESADENPVAPPTPTDLLKLADITNDWRAKPKVEQAGIRAFPFIEQKRLFDLLNNLHYLVAEERLARGLDSRDPALKKGVFVDPFLDDQYRDAGTVQTAAVGGGFLQLAITPTVFRQAMSGPVMLNFTEEIILSQPLYSRCMPINPYQVFDPLPGEIELTPASDFWTEFDTEWLSAQTNTFGSGPQSTTETQTTEVEERTELIEFLRQTIVHFTVRGLALNEHLEELTFDGIDVTPAPELVAGASGTVSGQFTIPARVKAGKKTVRASGSAGRSARTFFAGQGRVETSVMRQITTVRRFGETPQATVGGFNSNHDGGNNKDPLAQTFTLREGRFIAGVNLRFCAKGSAANGVTVDLVSVVNGIPTQASIAQAYVDMAVVVLNTWHECRFPAPVWVPAGIEVAFTIKTDDAVHALSVARLGDADAASGGPISRQPYTTGVLLSSSNNSTWTPHQDEDLAMQIIAARFQPVAKTHNFGWITVADMSDIVVRAAAELPTQQARLTFEVQLPGGRVIKLQPFQARRFAEYISGPVRLRAVLQGSETVSPVLYTGVTLIAGKIRTSGSYITKAFRTGSAVDIVNFLKARLPAGSTLAVYLDTDRADTWSAMTLVSTDTLDDGWIEPKRELAITGASIARFRIVITGGPAARPLVTDLMALAK